MKRSEKIIIAAIGAVMLVAILSLAMMLENDSEKINTLTAGNQAQAIAQQASSTQAALEQQQSCDALKVEYASECNQIEQDNEATMEKDILTCQNSAPLDTCMQNWTNDYKGQIGMSFIVSCENVRLAANSCPLLSL